MAGNWVRDSQAKPKERRLVLIYKPDDPNYEAIEALLEVIPYGKGNKTLLEALRFGAAATLKRLGSSAPLAAEQISPKPQPQQTIPAPSPVAAPEPVMNVTPPHQAPQASSATSDARTTSGGSANFSPAAMDMLQMGSRSPNGGQAGK